MAMANTVTVIYPPFENQEKFVTPHKWEILQTIGTWTNTAAAGNKDVISDLSSGAYEVRLINFTLSLAGDVNSSAAVLCTAAKDTFGILDKGTSTSGKTTCFNFGPIGMLVDITSTTAVVACVTTVSSSAYFYCQIAKRTK